MMKEKMRILYPLVAAICLIIAVVAASAAGQPGSTSDPLVTKSYVDQQIAQLSARIGSSSGTVSSGTVDSLAMDQLKTDVGDLTKFVIDALTQVEALKSKVNTSDNGFVILELKKGQKLILSNGGEAILRSGQASAIKGQGGNLIDISAGVELASAGSVPVQHLMLSHKNDGRGMEIKSGVAYLIVRGTYTIQ